MSPSIKDNSKEIKGFSGHARLTPFRKAEVIIAILVFVAAFGGFALGRLSTGTEAAVTIYGAYPAQNASPGSKTAQDGANTTRAVKETTMVAGTSKEGGYVASRTGSKYHLPWCPGAQSMREENKVWFTTKEDAERAGYQPASNCKGL